MVSMGNKDEAGAAYANIASKITELGASASELPGGARLYAATHAAVTLHGPISEHTNQPALCNGCKTPFVAFAEVPDLFEALSTDRPRTIAAARDILDRLGAWDATWRHPPDVRSSS
jgi:hypothetical protein